MPISKSNDDVLDPKADAPEAREEESLRPSTLAEFVGQPTLVTNLEVRRSADV